MGVCSTFKVSQNQTALHNMIRVPLHKTMLALGDYFILVSTYILAVQFRIPDLSIKNADAETLFGSYLLIFSLYAVVWLMIFQNFNLYKINVFLSVVEQFVSIIKAIGYGLIGLILVSYFTKDSRVLESRLVIGIFSILVTVSLLIYRIGIYRNLFLTLARRSIGLRDVIIVGAGKQGKEIAKEIQYENRYGLNVIGFLDDAIPKGAEISQGAKVLGTISEAEKIVNAYQCEEIIIAISNISYDRLHEIIDICKPIVPVLKLSSRLYEIVPAKVPVEFYGNHVVMDISNSMDGVHRLYKRLLDITISFVLLLLSFPILLMFSILIKIDSPGPILYRQRRIGKDGKLFWCYKLRSMYVDADKRKRELEALNEASGPIFKIKNDPRITRVGRIIRKYSIDEIPQLFNVLLGQMSLVGPRPGTPDEIKKYEGWHKRRLKVPQGITGLWQVSGRSNLSFNDMVVLDLYYAENASVMMDINIMLRTIPVVLFGRGAY
jgi:exopolysaccharide biosynthesis polyprenyl glycosylphosphotransferase